MHRTPTCPPNSHPLTHPRASQILPVLLTMLFLRACVRSPADVQVRMGKLPGTTAVSDNNCTSDRYCVNQALVFNDERTEQLRSPLVEFASLNDTARKMLLGRVLELTRCPCCSLHSRLGSRQLRQHSLRDLQMFGQSVHCLALFAVYGTPGTTHAPSVMFGQSGHSVRLCIVICRAVRTVRCSPAIVNPSSIFKFIRKFGHVFGCLSDRHPTCGKSRPRLSTETPKRSQPNIPQTFEKCVMPCLSAKAMAEHDPCPGVHDRSHGAAWAAATRPRRPMDSDYEPKSGAHHAMCHIFGICLSHPVGYNRKSMTGVCRQKAPHTHTQHTHTTHTQTHIHYRHMQCVVLGRPAAGIYMR